MEKIMTDKVAERVAASRERIADVYRHKPDGRIPFLVNDVNYWLTGETPDLIPSDYFTCCETMMRYQTDKIQRHLELFDDDYVPYLFPWYGTGVLASALGARILFQDKMDPAVHGAVISDPSQIAGLEVPDPRTDGLMPRVLETLRYFREHSDLPLSFSDPQGPLTTALTLAGPENFFVWLYEYPREVHALLEFCTELFIRWIRVQQQEMGTERGKNCFPHGIILPEEFGGVWLCDDDCGQISPEQYREFIVPCNARIFKEFGGGTLHFCGSAEHQLENLVRTEGLTGVNNFCMGNFRQIYKMQELFASRIALKVCDFTPLHVESYYGELFLGLQRRGTIVASFVSPEMALNEGRYDCVSRSGTSLALQAYESLTAELGRGNGHDQA